MSCWGAVPSSRRHYPRHASHVEALMKDPTNRRRQGGAPLLAALLRAERDHRRHVPPPAPAWRRRSRRCCCGRASGKKTSRSSFPGPAISPSTSGRRSMPSSTFSTAQPAGQPKNRRVLQRKRPRLAAADEKGGAAARAGEPEARAAAEGSPEVKDEAGAAAPAAAAAAAPAEAAPRAPEGEVGARGRCCACSRRSRRSGWLQMLVRPASRSLLALCFCCCGRRA